MADGVFDGVEGERPDAGRRGVRDVHDAAPHRGRRCSKAPSTSGEKRGYPGSSIACCGERDGPRCQYAAKFVDWRPKTIVSLFDPIVLLLSYRLRQERRHHQARHAARRHARQQYERELLFATVMSRCRSWSVRFANRSMRRTRRRKNEINVSAQARRIIADRNFRTTQFLSSLD